MQRDRAEEWLELGSGPNRRPAWRPGPRVPRPVLIGLAVVALTALIGTVVLVARPIWIARQASLSEAQVRTALAGLDLVDARLRSVPVDPQPVGAGGCGVLRGLVDVDGGAGGLPSVQTTGRVPAEAARVTVAGVVLPTPAAADGLFGAVRRALRDPNCLQSRELGRLAVDPWPQPDRRLGYLIAVPAGGTGAGETWWYRARLLRFGNTISYLSSFGPTGSADVTAELTDALERAYAEVA